MRPGLFLACSCAVLLSTAPLSAAEDEWPQFRGPNRDGRSPDVGLLKKWPSGGPKLLWSVRGIGAGFSSASVAGGRVYITGVVGKDLVITAFDMNGKPRWKRTHGPGRASGYPGSRSSVTVNDGRLYLLSAKGILLCYSAKTGKKRWFADLTKSFGGGMPGWGYAESVLVYKNLAIVTPGRKNCIVALDKRTGRTVWTSSGLSDPAGYASCVPFVYRRIPLIATMTAKGMVCIEPAKGRLLWRNDRPANTSAVCPSPVYSDGYVFGASGYNNGGACVKLSVSGGRLKATQVWETKDMITHHGGYVIVDGYIYGNHKNGWTCLDLKTGRKMWNARGVGKGSLCYADGMLYTFSESNGKVGLVHADPKGFRFAGEFSVKGRKQSWANPVVIGGRLYLRYDDNLYVYDVRGPRFGRSRR